MLKPHPLKNLPYTHIPIKLIHLQDHLYLFESHSTTHIYTTPIFPTYQNQTAYPPILLEQLHNHYRLACGLSQILFLQSHSQNSIQAYIFKNIPQNSIFLSSILHFLSYSTPNLFQQSLILQKCPQFLLNPLHILKTLLQPHSQNSAYTLKQILTLHNIHPTLQNYILQNHTPLPQAHSIAQFPHPHILLYWLPILKPNIHFLNSFLNSLNLLLQQRNILPHTLTQALLSIPHQNIHHKIIQKSMSQKLFQLAFPHYQKSLSSIQNLIKSFKLPHQIKIQLPQNLEGNSIQFRFSLKNQNDLPPILKKLNSLADNNLIQSLLTLLAHELE